MWDLINSFQNRGLNRNIGIENLFDNLSFTYSEFFGDQRYKNKDGNLVYEIECPGFNKDNLSVEIDSGILTVQGTRGEGDRKREIFKSIHVKQTEEVEAEIKDGILYLVFKQPVNKTNKIKLK